ncbi:hypothetical protein KKH23_01240 [Patescibacteria group bacterium]|nr:hypothetical protein [Patescibacteria group bacterium]MBU0777116.1 hypothetical protein [Patescibacteria group bacterium]MBU0845810.1 hypothetical protein [Patescibacteria group bacterium]MBU0922837.1 hypothetical protein [Patescibacteria group bacterium]MBU1066430.1 hypothetical protein [Patescibacteria group bacterium]
MSKERKFHVNFEETLIAAASGAVFGTAIGSAKYLGTPLPEATRIALTCVPLALVGFGKTVIRKNDEQKQRKSTHQSLAK